MALRKGLCILIKWHLPEMMFSLFTWGPTTLLRHPLLPSSRSQITTLQMQHSRCYQTNLKTQMTEEDTFLLTAPSRHQNPPGSSQRNPATHRLHGNRVPCTFPTLLLLFPWPGDSSQADTLPALLHFSCLKCPAWLA